MIHRRPPVQEPPHPLFNFEPIALAPPLPSPSESTGSCVENKRMKGLRDLGDVFHTPLFVRITVLALTAVVSFYLDRHWSAGYPQLVFYTGAAAGERHSPLVAVSTNANLTLDVSALLAPDAAGEPPLQDESPEVLPSSPSRPPPPPLPPARIGIVDENGTVREDFDVGRSTRIWWMTMGERGTRWGMRMWRWRGGPGLRLRRFTSVP
ncbi:hypothetical protein COCNU_contig69350995G000010 [Cocos nucifera]|nr:hypothetical protein [Cocos nucifera]